MNEQVPTTHPRYHSLLTRNLIVRGVEQGITSMHGLIAHGRGEALDYLIGERTNDSAQRSISAAAAMIALAKHPVISVNGNVAALVPDQLVALAEASKCPLEVNIFHAGSDREQKIADFLIAHGATSVLLPQTTGIIPLIDSHRRYCHPEGILIADVVIVPLEDGDRCEALVKMGKKVITVDLNPLSRTARTATITIVDNVIRALPSLVKGVKQATEQPHSSLNRRVQEYSNSAALIQAEACLRGKGEDRSPVTV